MRSRARLFLGLAFLAASLPALAIEPQGFSLGIVGGYTWSNDSVGAFAYGGQIRFRPSSSFGLEARVTVHEDTYQVEGQDVFKSQIVPLQLSLQLFILPKSFVQVVVLGGAGWYFTDVTVNAGNASAVADDDVFGWHAGLGADLWIGSHFTLSGDVRWVFLNIDSFEDLEELYHSKFKDDFYTASLAFSFKF